jgi:hypothetical protein
MLKRAVFSFLLLVVLGPFACGSSQSSSYSDKCSAACDPSALMACATMEPSACQQSCLALTSGLSATCATCLTQKNAWSYARDRRGSGSSGTCYGYAFPSITDTSSIGCASSCK